MYTADIFRIHKVYNYIYIYVIISLYHLRLSSGYLDAVHFCAFGRSDLDGDKANPWHHLSYSPESSLSAEQAWRCRSRVDVGLLNVRLESKELFEKHRKAMVTMRGYCGLWNVSIWFSNSSSKPRDSIFSCFYWLVVPTPLKNISQLGFLFPIYGKIKNVPNHQPV